jgi:hypothetical protein
MAVQKCPLKKWGYFHPLYRSRYSTNQQNPEVNLLGLLATNYIIFYAALVCGGRCEIYLVSRMVLHQHFFLNVDE